jgi:hypothetical protein
MLFGLVVLAGLASVRTVLAIDNKVIETPTSSASAVATVSADVKPSIIPAPSVNITNPSGESVNYDVGKWNGLNSMRQIIKMAIDRGVATNTIVLLLLLPLIATLVSVLHYVFGLTGYGIFMPTMIAITFLATGIFGGLLLFAMILVISVLSNFLMKKLKLHFWPARAINLLFISLGTFILMVFSSFIKIVDISQISIFPILFMILLAEEFVRTQLVKSKSEAKNLTLGTLILAITGAITMNFQWIQNFVLKNPELVILLVVVINWVVGNYTGIRLAEIQRFKKAIREKKY